MPPMPELPEVETVRRTLEPLVCGRRVVSVALRRSDVVHGTRTPHALLRGSVIDRIDRHGKQLALIAAANGAGGAGGRCVCIHLGMTGTLTHARDAVTVRAMLAANHTHVAWRLHDGGVMTFRDPRRFGGLWTVRGVDDLTATRWAALGEDALTIRPGRLHAKLRGSRRPLKAALLDQAVIAGLGNIYVDEALHAAGLHPLSPAGSLSRADVVNLVRVMRRILRRAIGMGGSTLRDYRDGRGRAGSFQGRHRVYQRADQPCLRCRAVLGRLIVSGRTTVFCPQCQRGVSGGWAARLGGVGRATDRVAAGRGDSMRE